ncbi:DNA-protecting protein DprA [Aliidiomarina sedimenti]|uniref:DNA-protecting protein DprA n=2 Tax=Aliidiomarina sedimenti TaxID=1933879 RepID=A0ABY0C0D3_9GAMM|nr:DNA-protecting protein DprA [Aliidiomarina sedimenti]
MFPQMVKQGCSMLNANTEAKLLVAALSDWISLTLAPRSLLTLLEKHRIVVGDNMKEPLDGLTSFWRQQFPGCSAQVLKAAVAWLEEGEQRAVVSQACSEYPEHLRQIDRAPPLLFVEGDVARLGNPLIAVVGSRRASPYGLEQTEQLSGELVAAGWGVCSGMAMGVDAAAHRAALSAGGVTLAVLGTGPDICYPPRQRDLYHQLRNDGLVVSEFFPGTAARSDHFLRRNRIISGLSQAVLVCEASARSGSLATARFALEQNRSVMAVPGPITQSSYAGNHSLIQQGAKLITSGQDILDELPPLVCNTPLEVLALRPDIVGKRVTGKPCLANEQMLANVGFETTSVDSLVERTRLPVAEVMNQLISLELDGWVTAVPGGYVRVRRE